MEQSLVEKYGFRNDYASAIAAHPDDEALILEACAQHVKYMEYASEKMKDNKELVLHILAMPEKSYGRGQILANLSKRLQDDNEVVCECLHNDGKALAHASDRLKNDSNMVYLASMESASALQYASEELRDSKTFIMNLYKVGKRSGDAFQWVSERLRDDEDVVRLFCQKGINLRYASERLRDREDIVYMACRDYGYAFRHASERLRDDKWFVLSLFDVSPKCFQFVSERLCDDEEVIRNVCAKKPKYFSRASERLKKKKELALQLCKADIEVYESVESIYSDDDDIARLLLENHNNRKGYWLMSLSERLRDQKEYIWEWCRHDGAGIRFASERLRNDKELCQFAFEHGAKLENMGETARDDYELVFECVRKDGFELEYASDRLKNDIFIVLTALNGHFPYHVSWQADDHWGEYDMDIFEFVGADLKQNPGFAKIVVQCFMNTSFGEKYSYEKLMEEPLGIFGILEKERDALVVDYCYTKSPKEGMDFSKAIQSLLENLGR